MISTILLLFFGVTLSIASTDQEVSFGDWSEVENGFRVRIGFSEGEIFNESRIPHLYVEIENATEVMGPRDFVWSETDTVSYVVVDEDGKKVPFEGGVDASVFVQREEILLPILWGGRSRIRVDRSGYGIAKGLALVVQTPNFFWNAKDEGDFSLTGKIKVGSRGKILFKGKDGGALSDPNQIEELWLEFPPVKLELSD